VPRDPRACRSRGGAASSTEALAHLLGARQFKPEANSGDLRTMHIPLCSTEQSLEVLFV